MATLVTWDEFSGTEVKGGTIKEIVMSEVANLVATDRPLMALLDVDDVESTFVERLEDTLGSRAHNAQPEGVAFTAPDLTTPSRLGYHVQTFTKWGQVSDEQRKTSHYNEDPFSYQVGKATEELMNDIEHTLHQGTVVSGASGTARQLEGLISVFNVAGTTTFETNSSGTTFTEQKFIERLQTFKDNDLTTMPRVALVNSWLKRSISEFSTKVTRNVDAIGRQQILLIERHSSDFGTVDIVYSRDQLKAASATTNGNSFIVIDPAQFSTGWFSRPTFEQLSRDGLRDRFQMSARCTLLYKSRNAGGGGLGYVANVTL